MIVLDVEICLGVFKLKFLNCLNCLIRSVFDILFLCVCILSIWVFLMFFKSVLIELLIMVKGCLEMNFFFLECVL